jgi:Coenzyme PQQ synthesis protein D (PqqD)
MTLSLEDSLCIRPEVVFRELGDEAVLLNLRTGSYFGLDAVGARIWRLVEQHGSLARVLDALLAEYDVESYILGRDLLELAERLCTNGLSEVSTRRA